MMDRGKNIKIVYILIYLFPVLREHAGGGVFVRSSWLDHLSDWRLWPKRWLWNISSLIVLRIDQAMLRVADGFVIEPLAATLLSDPSEI